jgi:hypothetical protein
MDGKHDRNERSGGNKREDERILKIDRMKRLS